MLELTYLVLVGAATVSLTTVTSSGVAFRFPIILATVAGHALFMYHWSWASEITAETWFALHFVTMIPLVVALVLCLSRGSRSRAAFLALSYDACLAAYMAICSLLLCRKNLALSMNGRLFAIWFVVVAFNFAFVFLVSRRAALCRRQTSWGLPTLAVGLLFALLVASGMWPVSLIAASRADLAIFALAVLATGVTIPALCRPSHDNARDAEAEDEDEATDAEEEKAEAEVRDEKDEKSGEGEKRSLTTGAAEPRVSGDGRGRPPGAPQSHDNANPLRGDCGGPGVSAPPQHNEEGEALFNQARAIPHQLIPDFDQDGRYLELLGKSAAAGYAPALAKLGEYAMRRDAWVEAYYWMTQAKRRGMKNVDGSLREIRRAWAMADFPNQSGNVNALFSPEAGSLARALLHLDSGHEAVTAREFLKQHHPEFLAERTNLGKHADGRGVR